MSAIFYDAVESSYPVKKLVYEAKTPSLIALIVEGKNPGYANGDKVVYKAVDGNSFSGPIVNIYNAPASAGWPSGYTALYMAIGNAASFNGKVGGTVSPVSTASVVAPSASSGGSTPVVSASTILKDKNAGVTPEVAPVAPGVAVATGGKLPFGLSMKAGLAVLIVGVAAAYFFRRGKKK